MRHHRFRGWDEKRLRLGLGAFFLALLIPTGVLIEQAYRQLRWEAFHQYQALAEELAARIDARLGELIGIEERRSFADYAFLVITGDPPSRVPQRSPLSTYPVTSELPGLIGYFQVDSRGNLSSPLLPAPDTEPSAHGVSETELAERRALQIRIGDILAQNRLVQQPLTATVGAVAASAPRAPLEAERAMVSAAEPDQAAPLPSRDQAAPAQAESGMAQAAFDRLEEAVGMAEENKEKVAQRSLGRVKDLQLDFRFQAKMTDEAEGQAAAQRSAPIAKREGHRERGALPQAAPPLGAVPAAPAPPPTRPRIDTFASEVDPFALSLLDSGHFVLYRNLWRDAQRTIQGALIDQQRFLEGIIEAAFRPTALSRMSNLIVAYRGDVLAAFSGQSQREYSPGTAELRGTLLYQARLSTPLGSLRLIFSLTRLPAGPGAAVLAWVAAVLLIVLCGGFYLLYRLGVGQIRLACQQQDFVSAVSHELKTPLTSIRMYSEMLREGWVTEEKRPIYYRFIHDESERLSRLISNVLQLARMTRSEFRVDLKPTPVGELLEDIRGKIASQAQAAGFTLNLACSGEAGAAMVQADRDLVAQILINLVDNAVKFSAKAEHKAIDLACDLQRGRGVGISVRDYGPGIPKTQLRKIFQLFYRSESELTRETVGTGIGLALVRQLAQAMGGSVEVVNRDPGAEFRLQLPLGRAP